MTASCARFAASATSVKSLRKGSVDGVLTLAGGGGGMLLDGDCWKEPTVDVCCVVGEEMGASISIALRTRLQGLTMAIEKVGEGEETCEDSDRVLYGP